MSQNTILLTPSNEQLVQIANEYPQLNQEIKSAVLDELKTGALKYAQRKLQSKASAAYEVLYSDIEKKYFKGSDYWKSVSASFGDSIKAKFTTQIETHLSKELDKEFEEYINSAQFKSSIKSKLRERILALAIKSLDEQINEEAKKLTA